VERAGVIVGGCCLLVAIMRRLHLDHIIVSTHNLLDGVVAETRAAHGDEARAARNAEAQASRGHTT
jgi:exopolyphosphatase/pppGpp-phosphohydrolase